MSDLVVNVRQISSYPALGASNGTENLLVQVGGLGGPYQTISTGALVSSALSVEGPALGIGVAAPAAANGTQLFSNELVLQPAGSLLWNFYSGNSTLNYWQAGVAGQLIFGQSIGFQFNVAPAGSAGAPLTQLETLFGISLAGAASLPYGTLTVARDPAAAMEVATLNYVSNHTVASFNGRNGVVQLWAQDIYTALGYDSAIATQAWVTEQITQAFQNWLMTCPVVTRWNGRYGSVYLMLTDISTVFFQPGQQPITPTPPATSDDYSIANTAWVTSYVTETIAGNQGLATQAWVQANTVASFNNRIGQVVLTTADGTAAGLAPIASPQLSGIPTAPTAAVGNATSQIATTAFVWSAVQESTTGVVSWNGRTGVVTLDATDINNAGGALLNSPALTGVPTAPTATTGTTTTQLATCAFVLNEVQAIGAGVTSFNTRSGNVVLELSDIEAAGGAPIASPNFSGNPTTPTPASPAAATTSIANTNWVVQYNALNTVASFNSRIGAVTLNANDLTAVGALVNPSVVLTGNPVAPTAAPTTNTTQIATCAFVQQALTNLQGITVSPTPPASPYMGQAWFNSTPTVQQLYVYTGAAFVPSTNLSGYLPLSGGTMSGLLVLSGNASANLNPVPLQQLNSMLGGYVTSGQLTTALAAYLPLTGGTVTGNLGVNGTFNAPNLLQLTPGANPSIVIGSAAQAIALNAPATFAIAAPVTVNGTIALNSVVSAPNLFFLNPGANPSVTIGSAGQSIAMAGSTTFSTTATFDTTAIVAGNGIAYTPPGLIGGGNYVGFGLDGTSNASFAGMSYSFNGTGANNHYVIVSLAVAGTYFAIMGESITGGLTSANGWTNGNAAFSWSTAASDRRLKRNLSPALGDALATVNAIDVYDCDYQHPATDEPPERWNYTLVADEVQAHLPFAYMAPPDHENGYASLHPLHLIATLWRAVQQLSAEVTALKGAPA